MKRLFTLLLVLCVVLAVSLVLFSCDDDKTSDSSTQSTVGSSTGDTTNSSTGDTKVDYIIKVVDGLGEAFEEVVDIEVFKDGVSVGESAVRRGGALFNLEKGEYTYILKNFEGNYYYNEDACVLSTDGGESVVTVYSYADENDRHELWVPTENGEHVPYNAINVYEGGVYVTVDRPDGTYFVFTPTRGGIYRISYESSRAMTFGYYGMPHNVLANCPVEVVDKAFEIEVKDDGVNTGSGGTTEIVIGMSSKVVKNCVLKIERIGNAAVELPWVDINADKSATSADNHINSEFIDFDIKDNTLKAVFNENDGYYHLNSVDGPVIYLRISTAQIKSQSELETVYTYLPSFLVMCDTGSLGKIFFDENGTIVLKERYNEMFKDYDRLSGTSGLYPLNEQLATAVKNIGESMGWFNFENDDLHIFGEEKNLVVKENAWLFACVYEREYAYGTIESPAAVRPSADDTKAFSVLVRGGENVVVTSSASATLTFKNAQGVKVVLDDGTEVVADAETGVLTATVGAYKKFTIVNEGASEAVLHFTLVEKVG